MSRPSDLHEPGEHLHTEAVRNETFEFRCGPVWCPIVVWLDGRVFSRFESGPLRTDGPVPRMQYQNTSDLVWRRHGGRPAYLGLRLREAAGGG